MQICDAKGCRKIGKASAARGRTSFKVQPGKSKAVKIKLTKAMRSKLKQAAQAQGAAGRDAQATGCETGRDHHAGDTARAQATMNFVFATAVRTCFIVSALSNAAGAGGLPLMSRIHAAWRASTA